MDSFYGGKQGVSFIIKSRFTSIGEMVKNFKTGNEFTDVWYGEYCIIDTPNKNDKDNGKIYRRGMLSSINATLGGAEYIGQIVGPSSGTPFFKFGSLKGVLGHSNENFEPNKGDIRVYPTKTDENGDVSEVNYRQDINGNWIDNKDPIVASSYKASRGDLVAGMIKTTDGSTITRKYNDDIKWSWCNIRKANTNSESWFYLGFEIPYLVTEFQTKTISPYNENGKANFEIGTTLYQTTIEQKEADDGQKHPFYSLWELGIPKGIKGDSLGNLKVITPTADNDPDIYTWDQFEINNDTGFTTLKTKDGSTVAPGYSSKYKENPDDRTKYYFNRQIIIYVYNVYDNDKVPKDNAGSYYVYVGDFNTITEVTLSQDGILRVYYSHDGERVEENGETKFVKEQKDKLEWVTGIDISIDTGLITVSWNTGRTQDLTAKLEVIKNAFVNADGKLTFGFNTGKTIVTKDSSKPVQSDGTESDFVLRTLENISLGSELNENKQIRVEYNVKRDGQTSNVEYIGVPINSIRSVVINEINFHLLILFDDKQHRYDGSADLNESRHVITTADVEKNKYLKLGSIWVKKTVEGKDQTSGDISPTYWWLDLGSVKDDAGILVGKNITEEYLIGAGTDPGPQPVQSEGESDEDFQIRMAKYIAQKDIYEKTRVVEPGSAPGEEKYWKYVQGDENNIINYLNIKYSSGITLNEYDETTGTHKAVRGKIVTYGANNGAKSFYAFDYDANTWYYLGIISASTTYDARLADANITNNDFTNVRLNGVISFYRTYAYDTTALPIYWN